MCFTNHFGRISDRGQRSNGRDWNDEPEINGSSLKHALERTYIGPDVARIIRDMPIIQFRYVEAYRILAQVCQDDKGSTYYS